MPKETHYPSFNVMNEQDEWDDHTQSIVTSRLEMKNSFKFLTPAETELLRRVCSLLVDDERPEVLDFIVDHIDQTLHQSPGESQRKVGVPQAPELVRSGLAAMEQGSHIQSASSFLKLEQGEQQQYLQQISDAKAEPRHIWGPIPQQDFFKKLMSLTVESYCSHPKIWSEIGYGGPAYPRGYVRTELGQLDPWEAQRER
ncbi:gluconate 2-dehydrogenase subunit 3 family protein [Paenibacillus cremeus]|uniref:Gluconate 2-dehydrogenase subunit 3 family protein n=1 Tax=Paenibacillus cremeus TaxID=2163881 RepID=A0A559KG91_9BACL|nr:gluconate 2-dehydrogenase subunit 3 family protein [Paenibacillus cremeus]TVY11136.1 gluconate 2-dehydrogenase subunit 3 family protein [Paenibacillus cremeus]